MSNATRSVKFAASAGPLEATVVTDGKITEREWERAIAHVATVVEDIDDKVLFAKVKLRIAPDPARERPASAEVTLDINGDLVRVHAAARSLREATAIVHDRLQDKLRHRAQRRSWLRSRIGEQPPGEWRHGDRGAHRPDYFDRPAGERELVSHKSFAVDELTLDEAAFDLEQLDYDFYLFRDLATGEDAMIQHGPGGSLVLSLLRPATVDRQPTAVKLEVSDVAAPRLTIDEAIERLDADGERFVFFANADTGRGNIVYQRYDGHHGLITLGDSQAKHG